jgi:hypothetical protein
MPVTASFSQFSALPAELRLLIWEEALRVPTAAILDCEAHRKTRSLSLRRFGINPYLIGHSCKEAQRQMQQLCRALVPRLHSAVSSSSVQWFVTQHTMFCLADIESTKAFLELLGPDQLLGVKHVALAWTRFDQLARMCMAVAKMRPALDRLFIVRCEENPFETTAGLALQKNLDLSFGVMNGNTLANDTGIDADYFGALLLGYFDIER